MFRFLSGMALMLCAAEGRAGILRCSFTEPFFTLAFDSATHEITRVSADGVDGKGGPVTAVVSKKARLERTSGEDAAQTFEVTDGKKVILVLRLDGKGSDGMSDKVFPFSVEYEGQHGACDTRKYAAWDFAALLEDLDARR